MLPQENSILPREMPILSKKKPDDRDDTLIGILLSLAMVVGVWHYAVKSKIPNLTVKSPPLETRIMAPNHNPDSVSVDANAITKQPVVITPQPFTFNTTIEETTLVTPLAPKPITKAKPVSTPIKAKPKPKLMPPAVSIVKPAVIQPLKIMPPAPVAEPVAVAKVIVRESIEFANASARIPPGAMPRLLEIAALLKDDTRILKIIGHTDNIGSVYDNHVLSLKRAKAIRRFLVHSGVPAEHLTVEGAGSDNPIDDNATEEGRKRNRRIEITETP